MLLIIQIMKIIYQKELNIWNGLSTNIYINWTSGNVLLFKGRIGLQLWYSVTKCSNYYIIIIIHDNIIYYLRVTSDFKCVHLEYWKCMCFWGFELLVEFICTMICAYSYFRHLSKDLSQHQNIKHIPSCFLGRRIYHFCDYLSSDISPYIYTIHSWLEYKTTFLCTFLPTPKKVAKIVLTPV